MKQKILSSAFVISMILSGCGIESIFNGGLSEWIFCFLVAIVCAAALGGMNK